ncbi:MAG: hypothetical protein GF335_03315 [Candidatus Moranbacteria bacterium]|nr:hypothetical protein [Candidatus Moranbacteria bacterium]
MNKQFLIIGLVLSLVIGFLVGLKKFNSSNIQNNIEDDSVQQKDSSNNQSGQQSDLNQGVYYLFVGEGCGHCEKVENYIEQNNLKEKKKIEILEVFAQKANQKIYLKAFEKCGKEKPQNISVPVLYYNGNCMSGDVDIIEELK